VLGSEYVGISAKFFLLHFLFCGNFCQLTDTQDVFAKKKTTTTTTKTREKRKKKQNTTQQNEKFGQH